MFATRHTGNTFHQPGKVSHSFKDDFLTCRSLLGTQCGVWWTDGGQRGLLMYDFIMFTVSSSVMSPAGAPLHQLH